MYTVLTNENIWIFNQREKLEIISAMVRMSTEEFKLKLPRPELGDNLFDIT